MPRKAALALLNALPAGHPATRLFPGAARRAARRAAANVAPDAAPERSLDAPMFAFEEFGRAGLQLGGLDRDRQWVGAWGGRC